jgi:hypothetical protein
MVIGGIGVPAKHKNLIRVAGRSREKMDKRKKARQGKAKTKSSKANIHDSSEYQIEKAGYPPIRRKRTCRTMPNPRDRSKIF